MYIFIVALVTLISGFFIGYFIRKTIVKGKANTIEARTQTMIAEAKNKERELLIKAKDKALNIIDDAKREEKNRRNELRSFQKRLENRESLFDKKLLEVESKQQSLQDKARDIESIKEKIREIKIEQLDKLEKIAGMDRREAERVLLKNVEEAAAETLIARKKKLDEEGSTELEKIAKRSLANVIQRCAISHAVETTTTNVNLPSEEMKGRIIGREGRNIRTLEQLTGVEIVIDETPDMVMISGFSPIRRHVAKKALDALLLDGRINPAKIEESVNEAKKEIALDIKKSSEEACYELGITGLDPKLVQIAGRLKYRTSYGQNQLQHAMEVSYLSGLLAEQLGADPAKARKAGFLHDIGKAVDHEIQGTHPEIGGDIGRKFNLPDEIIGAIEHHHDDRPDDLLTIIVKTADAISGGRPGARRDSYEKYIQRLEELEGIAKGFEGVEKAYALQAGREVRVFVHPDKINDLQAEKMAEEIAKRIEDELKYPGEIKVHVIRERRITQYAR